MSAQGEENKATGPARFAALLDECRSIAVRHLAMLFNGVLENASDALLDFADKAESNVIQAQFFETIHSLERGRQNIKRVFEGEIKIGFAQFIKGRPLAVAGGAERAERTAKQKIVAGFNASGLQLLDKLAHEESAVIQTLAAKSCNRYLELLYALNQRLAIVNGGNRLDESTLPAGPTHVLNSFNASIRPLRVRPNVKLVLFAVFDRIVMTQLESLYEELNLCLLKSGVLPNLRPSVTKSANGGRTNNSAQAGLEQQSTSSNDRYDSEPDAQTGNRSTVPGTGSSGFFGGDTGGEHSVSEQLFGTIRELMAGCRRAKSGTAFTDSLLAGSSAEPPVEPYASNIELVSAISNLQVEHAVPNVIDDPARIHPEHVDKDALEAIRSHLQTQRMLIYSGLDRRRIPQIEIDVIDVVGMLFDCILNDEVLPNAVKALLSRLHTPYLKIAVLDKRMFSSEKHPARRLLNSMAEAGGKWVSQDRLQAGIYPQMQYVVNRVLNEFQDGLQLFEDLIEEFTASVEVLKEMSSLIEQRAREAAKGQEKLHLARMRAQQELATRTSDQRLPNIARKFLDEIWADHLMLILLRSRDGDNSQDFVEALRITDEIIWSVTPKHTPEEREQLSSRLPKLQHIIEVELGSLGGYSRDEQEDLYGLLKDLQADAVSGTEPDTELADATEIAEEIVVEAPRGTVIPEAVSIEEQQIIDGLRALKFGTLFDFVINPAGESRRLKLSWFSQVTSNYMFVDQTGVKAAVYPIHELARAMRDGEVHIVEEHNKPFFERALEAIRNILKSSAESQKS